MSYLSIEFGLLFILFLALYWSAAFSYRLQNFLLIIASYAIVASFNIDFALILFYYTITVYCLAYCCVHRPDSRLLNGVIVLLVLVMLGIFKYYNFFQESVQNMFASLGWTLVLPVLDWLLPIGLSFYTFHSVSYLVSVKRQELKPVSILDLLLYLSFFPSLIAGPINRATVFLPQITEKKIRQPIELQKAMLLLSLAVLKLFFLSAWLADYFVTDVFASPMAHSAEKVLSGIYAYAWQIYFNFSGYTDLVTALALLLGFQLPRNFNFPYLSQNLKEFWTRWHISLSQFIRDYVYFPLGGNRKGFSRTQLNLITAMVISGLWHGAGGNFILWGALHGIGLMLYNVKERYFPQWNKWLPFTWVARLLTFHFLCFTWIFFRCATVSDAQDMLSVLARFSPSELSPEGMVSIGLFISLILAYPRLILGLQNVATQLKTIHWLASPLVFGVLIWLIIVFSPPGVPEFIYASF